MTFAFWQAQERQLQRHTTASETGDADNHAASHLGGAEYRRWMASVHMSTFSMGMRHSTQMNGLSKFAHSIHVEMWPHGTSSAERGWSRQTEQTSCSTSWRLYVNGDLNCLAYLRLAKTVG